MNSFAPEAAPGKLDEMEIDRLYEEYLPRLLKFAKYRISSQMGPKFDEDDIVDTVFGSVIRMCGLGKFHFDDDGEFWRLLITITKRKICNKVRHYKTITRSTDREISSEGAMLILASPDPDPAEATELIDLLNKLESQLSDLENKILKHRIEGMKFHEIADMLGVCEQSVRRKMKVIRNRLFEVYKTAGQPLPSKIQADLGQCL